MRGFALPVLPWLLLGTACSSAPAPAPAAPPPPPSETAVAAAAAPATAEVKPANPAPPGDEPVTDPSQLAPESPPEQRFDFENWCIEHEVKADLTGFDRCFPAKLGEVPDNTVWCQRHQEADDGSARYYHTLYQAKRGKLVRLVELLVAVDLPAVPGVGGLGIPPGLKLSLDSADATHVSLKEEPERNCEQVRSTAKDMFEREPKLLKKALADIDAVCKSRGEYEWRAGTLKKKR